jgi:hypothetical protein
MSEVIAGESMYTIAAIIIIVAIMMIVFMVLITLGPSSAFGLLQGFMAMVAMYLVSSIHGILR